MIIERLDHDSINIIRIKRQRITELFVTALPKANENSSSLFSRLAQHLQRHDAEIVKMDMFGADETFTENLSMMEKVFGQINWPVTSVVTNRLGDQNIAGVQVHAVSGVVVETISMNGYPVGRRFEDAQAIYCLLGGVHADDVSKSPENQTLETLEKLEQGLHLAGMALTDLVRTWFYNNNILGLYNEFNAVRTKFYREKSIFDGLIPASTGMGGSNPAHAALVAGALAMQFKNSDVSITEIPSPMQCSANDYGSSFSRAVEITLPDHRRLLISGTASIDSSGKTVHVGDIDSQITLTLEIIEAILRSRGMDYSDVTRSIAYFKPEEPVKTQAFDEFGLSPEHMIIVQNDICRDDLLFEIEVDAIAISE